MTSPLQGWERPGVNARLIDAIGRLVPAHDPARDTVVAAVLMSAKQRARFATGLVTIRRWGLGVTLADKGPLIDHEPCCAHEALAMVADVTARDVEVALAAVSDRSDWVHGMYLAVSRDWLDRHGHDAAAFDCEEIA
jgi:hypothetical protein